jgi:hypothetical protein
MKHQTTTMELFRKTGAAISSVYPNGNIRDILNQIGSSPEVLKQVILENTLFKYFTRFRPIGEKQTMLEKALAGELTVITSIRRFSDVASWRPRFCPQCAADEVEQCGEPYWHIDHQIPLMTLCPVHGGVLQQLDIESNRVDYSFIPLSSVLTGRYASEPCVTQDQISEWTLQLCKILHDYYALPFEKSIRTEYSNLAISLADMGYEVIQKKSPNVIINSKSLYHDMVEVFGKEAMDQQFGEKPATALAQLNRLCKWQGQVPERYALLQVFAGVSSAVVFSQERVHDKMEERLSELRSSAVPMTKKQITKELGVTTLQLDNLLKKYDMEPFWRPAAADSIRKPYKVRCSMTEADYKRFEQAFIKSGYRYSSEFVEHLLLMALQE